MTEGSLGVRCRDRQLRSYDRLQPNVPCRLTEPHDAAQVVVVREGQSNDPQLHGPPHQRFRRGGAVEQREGGVAMELGVRRHGEPE
jgi:hypothetical protein